jgi:hypothetical protein
MVQSINVREQTTFIDLVNTFRGPRESDHHLRLKDGDQGKMLYVHSKNHGVPHKRAEIMERRFEASQEVLRLFRERYSGSEIARGAVEKVISHFVRNDLGEGGDEKSLQLRGSDVWKMYVMVEREMEFKETMERYPTGVFNQGVAKTMGIDIRNEESTQRPKESFISELQSEGYGERLGKAIKDHIGALSMVARDDPQVQGMCSEGVQEFRQAIWKHQDLFACPEVLDAPELKDLRPLIGGRLVFENLMKDEDFSAVLKRVTGSPPTSEPPKDETSGSRLFNNRMIQANQNDWKMNEIEARFFGTDDVLRLGEEGYKEVRAKLDELNENISDLKQQIKNEPDALQKEDLALQLQTAISQKKTFMENVLDARIETEQVKLRGSEDPGSKDPITKVLTSLETEGGKVEGEHLRDMARGRRERTEQFKDFLKS